MPFFFRIIAKNSKCSELPEVSLRRSPTAVLTNINDNSNTASKKKNVSFKEDVESFGIKAEKDTKFPSSTQSSGMSKVSNGNLSPDFKKSPEATPPRVESIKLKFDVSNNNVSIIKPNSIPPKLDQKFKQQRSYEKKEKKGKLEKYEEKSPRDRVVDKKDEYEFDDETEKEKLGFLNTFQLTAKKMLAQRNSSNLQITSQNKSQAKKDELKTTSTTKFEEGKISSKSFENSANKRKNKEPVKSEKTKKYKFHEMKSVGEGNKFLFTKTGDGHEITFDMSPKPLGSKPPLSKVKSDILMAQQRADAKANQSKGELSVPTDKNQANKNVLSKPKKLPLLLPKQTPQPSYQNVISTSVAPTSMSPTAFVIQKPALSKEPEISSNSEISVTKINDSNHHYRVYGPKSPDTKPKDLPLTSPDVFAQPLPPKPKPNLSPFAPPTTIMPPSSPSAKSSPKQSKNIHENMQTPYGNRTPFYVPSSPSYIPNFDPKPQFKYANPNMQFASFMQSMFTAQPTPQGGKISPPNTIAKTNESRKRLSTDSSTNAIPSKRKSPSPSKTTETDSKAISILNKINFPSSLSVTLTNEQEENKKEQLRSQQQNVNNNIEIIKLSEEKEAKSKSPSPPKTGNSSDANDKKTEKKLPELKKLLPSSPSSMPPPAIPAVAKALSEKESFQRAFLESIMSVSNRLDRNVEKSRKKSSSPDSMKNNKALNNNDVDTTAKESKSESNQNSKNSSTNTSSPTTQSGKKNLSLTPPLSKNVDKSNSTTALKSLTPPPQSPQIPIQDHSIFSPAVAASSAIQFNLMMNALNAPHFGVFPDYANIQRNILLETLRKNVEKSNALLAMHHQMQQQQQQNQKASPNSPSSSSSSKH